MSAGNYTESRLKEAVLEQLVKIMEGGVPVTTKEGDVVVVDGELLMKPATHQDIQAATSFLKVFPPQDLPNPEKLSPTMQKYGAKMPFKKEQK